MTGPASSWSKWPAMYQGRAAGWPDARVRAPMPRLDGALCVSSRAGLPPDAWAPGADPEDAVTALVICERCPALRECAAWTLSAALPGDVGVMGGHTPASLRSARRRAQRDRDG